MAEKESLRQMDINQSMTKPLMILGCDRRLLLLSSLGCLYTGFNLGITQGNIGVTVMAIVLWIVIRFALKLMGKHDPLMLDVFQRHVQYSSGRRHGESYIFLAHGSVDSKLPGSVKKRWI